MKKFVILLLSISLLASCTVGNAPFAERRDTYVGTKVSFLDPTRFGNAGDLIRSDYMVAGDGFTHITKNENGDIVQHWFISEVLPNFVGEKEWVGKCKIFYVVDPKTNIIKSWGYDEGGNPQSCRDWP
ncbi:hypothetical protein L2719_16130 [Shewanella schlegeliana]|uniref:Lipoprotein n=1 Tax=Shewanella schlegeliana TaxID=190308 RepID=A0ABS1T2Q5_9GAMM|nr:hypothetical protein [Shewanella schlegeliana]MBL4915072.1 hypothetical protein [Shewanella schlegeliana]MCL1111062.1 hypothetical protein [Shewanella schlegeliana]GIU38370.1 hypothetical protein TUM4433_39910 [Shewanella schlegeliana]